MYTRTELQRKRAEAVIAMTGYADTRGAIGEKEAQAIANALNLGIDIGYAAKAAEEKSAADPAAAEK